MRINESAGDDFDDAHAYFVEVDEYVDRLCTPEYVAAKMQEIMLRVNGYPQPCPRHAVLRRRRR
jgi:hypothetical protein